jgi:hypothetical protein
MLQKMFGVNRLARTTRERSLLAHVEAEIGILQKVNIYIIVLANGAAADISLSPVRPFYAQALFLPLR